MTQPSETTAAQARRRLAYDGLTIDVESDDPTLTDWLVEFLGPAFNAPAADRGPADHRIVVRIDSTERARLAAEMRSAQPVAADAFTRDGHFSRMMAWTGRDERHWFHHPRFDAFVGVDGRARTVEVVLDTSGAAARRSVMRITRELATVGQHRAGRLALHGSAFVLDGSAVLVCGPKRSGKTTLLIHALRRGAAFLSNDRVFATTDARPIARAMPTIVMLRQGTLSMFPGLEQQIDQARCAYHSTLAECAQDNVLPPPAPSGEAPGRPGLSPAQLCRLLGAPMLAEAPVSSILIPVIDPAARGVVLEPMAPSSAEQALRASLMKPSHPTRYSTALAPHLAGHEVTAEHEAACCRQLVAAVPVSVCRLGPDAFAGRLDELLSRARAARASDEPQPRA